jgi:hypothetical protein
MFRAFALKPSKKIIIITLRNTGRLKDAFTYVHRHTYVLNYTAARTNVSGIVFR